MTEFEKEKRKIRIAGMAYNAACVYIVINSIITLSMDVPLYSSKAERLIGLVAYLSWPVTAYFLRYRKCILCKNGISAKEIKKMGSFQCPHCGNTEFAEKSAEIWFK